MGELAYFVLVLATVPLVALALWVLVEEPQLPKIRPKPPWDLTGQRRRRK